jgi:hypothetical protein
LIDTFNSWILLVFVFLSIVVVLGFIWVKFSKKPAQIEEEMSILNRLTPKKKNKGKGAENNQKNANSR